MAEISYGGQAVIEGVMIRSPRYVSVACRLPQADGSPGVDTPIDVHTELVDSWLARRAWVRRVPLLRGMAALFEMLGIGLRSLERSGNLQLVAEATATAAAEPTQAFPPAESPVPSTPPVEPAGTLNGPMMWTTIAISFAFGIALFVLLPNLLAARVLHLVHHGDSGVAKNLSEGLLRLVIFVAYIGGISLLPDIRRVFAYHGAEHRVVNGFEAGRDLTADSVADMSVIHPRCGTNFAFIVIVLSLIIFSFLPWKGVLMRMVMRLACLPLVAGLGFELVRFVGKYRGCRPLQALIAPGLWLQRITTRPPQRDMVEVALASFNAVKLAEETGELTCTRLGGAQS